jgi:thiopeptide-type bacteriocin biosynthesis protein
MAFNLIDLFPKLSYYPRVNFENLIVSPAMWLIPSTLYKSPNQEELPALQQWLLHQQINFRFKSGYADATLCFDPREEGDLLAFLNFCKHQIGDVYISEALVSDSSCISDQFGARYLPQYILNYGHTESIYHHISKPLQSISKIKNLQMPGGDWLYFEIYSHPMKSNAILINQIHYFMESKKKKLKKWFFIRYNQPSPHLRIRLHLKNNADGFKLIEALKLMIEPEMHLGIATDFNIKTYLREIHRYGAKRMDLIEQFFMIDSQCVLYFLKRTTIEDKLMASALNLISNWLDKCIPLLSDQMQFTKVMAYNFATEMKLLPAHFKKINANFNTLKSKLPTLHLIPNEKISKAYTQLFDKILQTIADQNDLEKLLSDLIHMHVNRLFSVDQRMYETILYHYLLRLLQMKNAMINI